MRLPFLIKTSRTLTLLWACLLTACVSYESAMLVPSVSLSLEQVQSRDSNTPAVQIDFGLETGQNESDSLVNIEILPGVRVRNVAGNGPADSAGIEVGDIILAIDEMPTNHPDTLLALQQQGAGQTEFVFRVRRNTLVFEASVTARAVSENTAIKELYRLDPLATRAGYRSELVTIDGQVQTAARLVELYPDSNLPAAGVEIGDLILALEGRLLNSAQDLVSRLNREHELGERVNFTIYDGVSVSDASVQLWDPGRRISRVNLGPLLQYESSLSPASSNLTILDLWLFSFYSYNRREGERSHSLLELFNFTSDYGQLVEE